MLLDDGKYIAVVKDVYLYERGEQKRLTGAFKLEIEHDGKTTELVHREWLELNDGTISEKAIESLRECFPEWDGTIEALGEGFCCRDVSVQVVVENEQDRKDKDKYWTRTKYMNPVGKTNGGGADMPETLDRETLTSRYASRFNAVTGATAKPAAPAQAAHGSPPVRPPKAAPASGTSSQEACWDKLVSLHTDMLREQLEALWFELLEKTFPGRDGGDFTPAEWAAVLATITAGAQPAAQELAF